MVKTDQELSDDELDLFLEEIGIVFSETPLTSEKCRLPSLPPNPPKKRRYLLFWFALSTSIGFLAGVIFGFFLSRQPPQLQGWEQNYPKQEIIEPIQPLVYNRV